MNSAAGAYSRSAAVNVSTPSFTLPSFAKINLSLRILGKRPDGYHEVETVLQTVSLHDELRFAANEGRDIVMSCDDPSIPTDESNLIVRAANGLRTYYEVKSGAFISLEKRIPAKGGLGGGSSNAATTLIGLTQLWTLTPKFSELIEIAAGLGADVPFFLHGGLARAQGIGTQVLPLPDAVKQHLLIVSPRANVSTVEAYKALRVDALTTKNSDSILAISRSEGKSTDSHQWLLPDQLENEFERVIFDIEPEIGRAKTALLQAGARGALLAGSGSSVFGIFASQGAQQRALKEIRTDSGWRIFPCVTLSREEYFQAMGLCGTALLRSFNLGI
ncbi:MAG: 4-(cytidine 5'-diphospho)-2-C-methyl-D-erythritol kinase [Pyrinomonadaceae bacterium]